MSFMKYEDLEVYKRAYRLALDIHRASQYFPKTEQYGGMAEQMRRAAKSICANMAEGESKMSSAVEERRFLSMGLGSCEEMRVWLKFSEDLGYIPAAQVERWRNDYTEIGKMLFALIRHRSQSAHNPKPKT